MRLVFYYFFFYYLMLTSDEIKKVEQEFNKKSFVSEKGERVSNGTLG